MAKEVLVTETLSEQMVAAGLKLVERLDADHAGVAGVFWLFHSEEKRWELTIASPLVVTEGPRKFYKRVFAANQQASAEEYVISLHDIAVTGIDHQIVQLLRLAIDTGVGVSGVRFSRNTVNGVFIEDAYVYRSEKSTSP
ncbi:MAG: hypothetical protein CO095_00435 [Armatimonadetes bacterium CG_4_9_14_3_um_filter_58_7]|nr:MAG: hypothetical protein CO095_00435 [Armatimonadetes bacterium CG_4_9_14_3_um_filter_58_7]